MKKRMIIIVGHSGSGKSTFISAMNLPEHVYVTSDPMRNELNRRGLEINHDTIFELSEEWYDKDQLWQIPLIQNAIKDKSFLILDGTRRLSEVEKLKKIFKTIMIAIVSSSEVRFERLKKRTKIPLNTIDEFNKLELDEGKKMDMEVLVKMADFVIENDMSSEMSLLKLKEEGQLLGLLLKSFM